MPAMRACAWITKSAAPRWTRWSQPCGGGAAVWVRSGVGGCGGATGITQTLNRDVSAFPRLVLTFRIRADYQSLSSTGWGGESTNCGTTPGEAPAGVQVNYSDEDSQYVVWGRSFLYQNTTASTSKVRNFTMVPRSSFYSFTLDLAAPGALASGYGSPVLKRPVFIYAIQFGGDGWDFTGAVDDVSLTGS